MTCRELAELLCDFVGDELSEELCATLRAHLDCCPECVHFVETYRLTIQITRRLPPAPPPESLLERLRRAAQSSE